ncbi:MAG: hypothetical protein R2912_04705 [Eubacteriales bacterium]
MGFREEAYLEKAFESYADSVTRNIGGYVVNDADFALNATYHACAEFPCSARRLPLRDAANANLFVSLEKHMARRGRLPRLHLPDRARQKARLQGRASCSPSGGARCNLTRLNLPGVVFC